MASTIGVLARRAFAPTCLVLVLGGAVMAQWYVDDRASTPAESYARGMSDIVRSQGAYNLATSEAAINMTEARQQSMRNQEEWTHTYFQMREANRSYRDKERGPRPTPEDIVRYAQMGKPDRLSPGEIDPVSGTLDWPGVLKQSMFAEERERLEDLFANWTEYGSVGFEQRRQIRSTTDAMLGKLKQHVNDMPPPEYVTAKRFLESLAYEAYLAAS